MDLDLFYATASGPIRAVDSVSFAVQGAGQTIGIIGESGSGKSSIVSALSRVLPRNVARYCGQVLLAGRDLMPLSNDQYRREIRWKKISVVFQGSMNGFNPVIRMGRQLSEPMLVEKTTRPTTARAEVGKLLEAVGLPPETYDRYPHELSGGMKQRAAIAMALVFKPPVVILDEPTSALDVSVQAQIMNTLKRLKWDMGVSMLFVTHDIALASDLSDRVAVMYAGQIREYGAAEQVLSDPQDPYTQELLASIPRLHDDSQPRFVSGTPPDPTAPPLGCRFCSRCPQSLPLCAEQPPGLLEVGKLHFARCWLHARGTA